MRIADLCCGAGGAAMGLHQAFPDAEIVGIDIQSQPRYPFTFVQGDALEFDLSGFDFAWASWPCQRWTAGRRQQRSAGDDSYTDLLTPGRALLQRWGGPWIMENVPGSPLKPVVMLCGEMFSLRVQRHRFFESNFLMLGPAHMKHRGTLYDGYYVPVYGGKWRASGAAGDKGPLPIDIRRVSTWKTAMGIDWMRGDELSQAVPPAYARYLAQFIPVPAEVAA